MGLQFLKVACVIQLACGTAYAQHPDEPHPILFETLIKNDSHFHRSESGFIVLRGPGDESAFLSTFFPRPSLPEVDYFSQMVLGVCGGVRSMTGHSIEIDEIIEGANVVIVYYTDFQPTLGFAYQSWPIHLVAIPRTKLPVEFRGRVVIENERKQP